MRIRSVPLRCCSVLSFCTLVAIAAGCSNASSPTSPSSSVLADAGTAVASSVGETAVSGATNVTSELAAVRRSTAKYHDLDAALADGYVLNPAEPCVSSPAGIMGVHVLKPSLLGDGVVNAETPEALLYLPREDGTFRLLGVEYLLFFTPTTPTPSLFGQVFDGPMPGHTATMPTHWDLHAWIWANNPSGMLAQFNPSLSCP